MFPLVRLMQPFPGFCAGCQSLSLKVTSILWCRLYIRSPRGIRPQLVSTWRPLLSWFLSTLFCFPYSFFPGLCPSLFSPESVIQTLLALKARNCLFFHLTSAVEWISPLPIRALVTSLTSLRYIRMLALQNCNKVSEMLNFQRKKICFQHKVVKVPVHG